LKPSLRHRGRDREKNNGSWNVFWVDDNQVLQLAAVEAVIRCRGRTGLGLAVCYQQATHWWEEDAVAKQLSAMLRAEQAPGNETLVDCQDLKTLQK